MPESNLNYASLASLRGSLTQYPGVICRILGAPSGFDTARYRKTERLSESAATRESMSFEAVVASERRVIVWCGSRGQLVEEILIARGGDFPPQVPLLDSHRTDEIANVTGVIGSFKRDGTVWIGRAELTPGVAVSEDAFKRVAAGHLNDVSIGYMQNRCTIIDPGQSGTVDGVKYQARRSLPLMITQQWSVYEVSLVPIGADSTAKIKGNRQLQEVTEIKAPRRPRRFATEVIGVFR
ncbi:HK97 family phage prohead protease [Botrimarina mediterranea]|uniref:HK97 family phage prohead protease n=1 Tax=Botrimarina mediterranea TaxID=2528022 RepID=UPI00118B556C|nr:Caudovirus prohead protease [Planctomycetes bacterium K2D]